MKITSKVFVQTLLFSVIVALGHWGLLEYSSLSLNREFLFKSHIFITILTLATLAAVVYVWKSYFDKVGFAFLGLVFLKIAAAMIFLFPIIKGSMGEPRIPVLHFFAAYFLYLLWDALQVAILLKSRPDEGAD